MSEDKAWFAPKRFGLGAGLPISWQGWAVTLAFTAVCIGAGVGFGDRPAIFASILVPAAILFFIVTAAKTRGGWRWRWGNDD